MVSPGPNVATVRKDTASAPEEAEILYPAQPTELRDANVWTVATYPSSQARFSHQTSL